jgi:hypothetical protein
MREDFFWKYVPTEHHNIMSKEIEPEPTLGRSNEVQTLQKPSSSSLELVKENQELIKSTVLTMDNIQEVSNEIEFNDLVEAIDNLNKPSQQEIVFHNILNPHLLPQNQTSISNLPPKPTCLLKPPCQFKIKDEHHHMYFQISPTSALASQNVKSVDVEVTLEEKERFNNPYQHNKKDNFSITMNKKYMVIKERNEDSLNKIQFTFKWEYEKNRKINVVIALNGNKKVKFPEKVFFNLYLNSNGQVQMESQPMDGEDPSNTGGGTNHQNSRPEDQSQPKNKKKKFDNGSTQSGGNENGPNDNLSELEIISLFTSQYDIDSIIMLFICSHQIHNAMNIFIEIFSEKKNNIQELFQSWSEFHTMNPPELKEKLEIVRTVVRGYRYENKYTILDYLSNSIDFKRLLKYFILDVKLFDDNQCKSSAIGAVEENKVEIERLCKIRNRNKIKNHNWNTNPEGTFESKEFKYAIITNNKGEILYSEYKLLEDSQKEDQIQLFIFDYLTNKNTKVSME